MYNADRKTQFLGETRSSSTFGESVFRTTESYEKEAGKDLCELSTEILQSMVNSNFGSRARSMDAIISFLQSYVSWCKEHGYSTSDNIYTVKVDLGEKVRRCMVASPRHLQNVLDDVFAPVDSNMVDCIYRCYLWMAFSGLDDADALEVRVDEVDFCSMLIEHGGKSFELYREAIPAFRLACEATEFEYRHPKYTTKRSRFPGEYLMRGIRSEKLTSNTIKGIVQKTFKANGVELTYGKIRLSGMFYRVYEMERMGNGVNFDDFIVESIIRRGNTDNKINIRSKVANQIKKDLFDDYAHWKSVFT